MVIYDSANYRIEHHPAISRSRPFALDHKQKDGGRTHLSNIGWYETESKAHRARNAHAERAALLFDS